MERAKRVTTLRWLPMNTWLEVVPEAREVRRRDELRLGPPINVVVAWSQCYEPLFKRCGQE
jgi:hypothetical protein